MTARILTPWIGTGSYASPFQPQLLRDHPLPAGATFADVTGQPAANLPTQPNAYMVEVTGYSSDWLSAVEADAAYCLFWDDATYLPDQVAPDSEFTADCQAVATMLGVPLAAVEAVVGASQAGRTRRAVTDAAIAWLQTLPAAS